jgi:kynurenine formamidase
MPRSRVFLLLVLVCGCQGASDFPVLDESRLIDLTYPFDSSTVYWPTAEPFELERVAYGTTESGYWYAANQFCASEHGGTHLDSPIHFAEGKWTADVIPLDRLVGPAVVMDVTSSVDADPDYRLQDEDILAWETRNGQIPDGAVVLMRTGWGTRWPDPQEYFGSDTPQNTQTLHFPGISREAAEFLSVERTIDAVGLDTPSIDHGPSQDFPAHQVLGKANIPAFENVANLNALPESGAWIIALPMKIGGGTGGPLRIVALLE